MRRRTSIGLCCLALAATALAAPDLPAQGDPVESASEQDKAQARARYLAGKQAFAQRQFDEALAGFRASYEIVASPNAHLMVVNTLVEMERYAEAYAEARAVAAEADAAVAGGHGKYGTTASAARRTMEWLRPQLAFVTVDAGPAEPGAVVAVNGMALDRSQWGQPVPVEPGTVSASLTSTAGEQQRQAVVRAGATATLSFRPEPPAPTPLSPGPAPMPDAGGEAEGGFHPFDGGDDQRLAAYVVGGVGATGMVLFAVLGGLHLSKHGEIEDRCAGGVCPPELADDVDTGRAYQTGANVSLVIGLVGLAGGAALFFTSDWFLDREETAGVTRSPTPTVALGPGGLVVHGAF